MGGGAGGEVGSVKLLVAAMDSSSLVLHIQHTLRCSSLVLLGFTEGKEGQVSHRIEFLRVQCGLQRALLHAVAYLCFDPTPLLGFSHKLAGLLKHVLVGLLNTCC